MPEPPDFLPEAGWIGKPQNDDEALERFRWSHRVLWLVALFFAAIIVGMTVILANSPALFVGDAAAEQTADAAARRATAQALNITALFIDEQATRCAQDALATGAALDRTATRLGGEVFLAQTAVANQATSMAFAFEGTRAALSYMETQSAISFAATQNALGGPVLPAVTALPPVGAASVQFEDDFSTGIGGGRWASDTDGWRMAENGELTAAHDGAWLLTRRADFASYMLEVTFTPQAGIPGSYDLLLSAEPETNRHVILRLLSDGQQITEASLLTPTNVITTVPVTATPLFGPLSTRVDVRDGRVTVSLYASQVLQKQVADLPERGAVGIQMPVGTSVQVIRVTA